MNMNSKSLCTIIAFITVTDIIGGLAGISFPFISPIHTRYSSASSTKVVSPLVYADRATYAAAIAKLITAPFKSVFRTPVVKKGANPTNLAVQPASRFSYAPTIYEAVTPITLPSYVSNFKIAAATPAYTMVPAPLIYAFSTTGDQNIPATPKPFARTAAYTGPPPPYDAWETNAFMKPTTLVPAPTDYNHFRPSVMFPREAIKLELPFSTSGSPENLNYV